MTGNEVTRYGVERVYWWLV